MAGFDHHAAPASDQAEPNSVRNRRMGLLLFAVYLALYGGFVGINAFRPELAERPALAGLNLAVSYGFALILSAFVLAGLYGWLCRAPRNGRSAEAGR